VESPFRIELWSKAFVSLGLLGDPQSVTVYPRHNQQPTAQLTVRTDHHRAPALLTEGCRVTIGYHGQQILSGVVDSIGGTGDPAGVLTVQVRDDWALLSDLLGWPVPTAAISAQNTAEYDTKTAVAETVVKWFAGRAITRLGLPVTVATDLGRGSDHHRADADAPARGPCCCPSSTRPASGSPSNSPVPGSSSTATPPPPTRAP
jgi:hypothetical protein